MTYVRINLFQLYIKQLIISLIVCKKILQKSITTSKCVDTTKMFSQLFRIPGQQFSRSLTLTREKDKSTDETAHQL